MKKENRLHLFRSQPVTAGKSVTSSMRGSVSPRHAGTVDREANAKKCMPDFCSTFVESALLVASMGETKRMKTSFVPCRILVLTWGSSDGT